MILFSRRPPLSDQPLPMPSYSPSSIRGRALEKEFIDLLHKGAIERAPQTPGFYSRLFVVQKDSGSWRPIIDLSTLNTFIVSQQVFTRLMAPISAILHRYGIRILRYLDDWLILTESRTTCIHARDRLLHLCEELGLQVNHKKSSLFPSQDMTYLGMEILSVRFIAKPTETRIGNLLRIIEEFLSSPSPPASLYQRLGQSNNGREYIFPYQCRI